jgi:hypothetical protein
MGPLGTALPTGAPAGPRADHPTARPTGPARGKEKLRIADDAARGRPATRQGRLPGGGWLRNDGGPRRSREPQHRVRNDADMSAPLCSPGTLPERTCQPARVREVPRASRQQPRCCRICPPMPKCHFRPQSSHGRNYWARTGKTLLRTGGERKTPNRHRTQVPSLPMACTTSFGVLRLWS